MYNQQGNNFDRYHHTYRSFLNGRSIVKNDLNICNLIDANGDIQDAKTFNKFRVEGQRLIDFSDTITQKGAIIDSLSTLAGILNQRIIYIGLLKKLNQGFTVYSKGEPGKKYYSKKEIFTK